MIRSLRRPSRSIPEGDGATIPRQAHHRPLELIYHTISVAPEDGALSKFNLES